MKHNYAPFTIVLQDRVDGPNEIQVRNPQGEALYIVTWSTGRESMGRILSSCRGGQPHLLGPCKTFKQAYANAERVAIRLSRASKRV